MEKIKRLIREPVVCDRLGVSATTLDEKFVKTGRLRWVYPSERVKAALETEVDALIEEIINARNTGTVDRKAATSPTATARKAKRERERERERVLRA